MYEVYVDPSLAFPTKLFQSKMFLRTRTKIIQGALVKVICLRNRSVADIGLVPGHLLIRGKQDEESWVLIDDLDRFFFLKKDGEIISVNNNFCFWCYHNSRQFKSIMGENYVGKCTRCGRL